MIVALGSPPLPSQRDQFKLGQQPSTTTLHVGFLRSQLHGLTTRGARRLASPHAAEVGFPRLAATPGEILQEFGRGTPRRYETVIPRATPRPTRRSRIRRSPGAERGSAAPENRGTAARVRRVPASGPPEVLSPVVRASSSPVSPARARQMKSPALGHRRGPFAFSGVGFPGLLGSEVFAGRGCWRSDTFGTQERFDGGSFQGLRPWSHCLLRLDAAV